jgi:hypothetical protein
LTGLQRFAISAASSIGTPLAPLTACLIGRSSPTFGRYVRLDDFACFPRVQVRVG